MLLLQLRVLPSQRLWMKVWGTPMGQAEPPAGTTSAESFILISACPVTGLLASPSQ